MTDETPDQKNPEEPADTAKSKTGTPQSSPPVENMASGSPPTPPSTPQAAPSPKPEPPAKDPIVQGSLLGPLFLFSVLLALSTAWAMYDEFYGQRPWKKYQADFVELYSKHLASVKQIQSEKEAKVVALPGYAKIEKAITRYEDKVRSELGEISANLNLANRQLSEVTGVMQDSRSKVRAVTYKVETTHDKKKKAVLRKKIEVLSALPNVVKFPLANGKFENRKYTYPELVSAFDALKEEKAVLIRKQAMLNRPASELRTQKTNFVKTRLRGLSTSQVEGLQQKMKDMHGTMQFMELVPIPFTNAIRSEIRQIHVEDVDLVDRCESCHMGIREPILITAEDMGGRAEFVSHPRKEILKIHNPESFGCSPCHGGNGIATTNKTKGHGRHKHWLWPMFEKENFEAGCAQCHDGALVTEHAPTLNKGKDLFLNLGCWGCHPRVGYDADSASLKEVNKVLSSVTNRRGDYTKAVGTANFVANDRDSSVEQVLTARASIEGLTLKLSGLDAEEQQLHKKKHSLLMQSKKVGPNLKEVRAKLKPEWIPVWLADTKSFRKHTKMPQFRLPEEHLEAISAFIWQAGLRTGVEKQKRGNVASGKKLFETRGCMACHSMGETPSGDREGGVFAADLSRVGEKANYDYLVRWVTNPRQRLQPYCSSCQRDISRGDYKKAGLAFSFDDENAQCPVCGSGLDTFNHTVMPNMRLSGKEARDIASYLSSLKSSEAKYPAAPFMNDTKLFDEGKSLVSHYGCAGCHEIAGLENAGRIGTDLTKEGSKPLERLDFGRLFHVAHKEDWANHKGFFERKLRNPAIYDAGKEITDPLSALRMPDFGLSKEEISALTTFLLGSVDSRFPQRFYHNPEGPAKDIQDGWWILKKYNCVGCHQVAPDDKPRIQDLAIYSGANRSKAPPSLVGVGARLDPDWLANFLSNPALSTSRPHRNGVRRYLDIRMPTFYLSETEVQTLVRFFAAMAEQTSPYVPTKTKRLRGAELQMARDAFVASDCLNCHAGSAAKGFGPTTIAPSFSMASRRLKPLWTQRWLVDPAKLMPGTQMPTGLFEHTGDRWVIRGRKPASMAGFKGDHVDLFVRYLKQFTDDEARLLERRTGK